ncbi:MAG: hypothetical protein JW940_26015 [Polyangiaceae bacterium]|nr:hypothetical protein [Polyangiaceae bacterium]
MNRFRPLLAEMPLREGQQSHVLGGLEWSRMQTGLMTFLARTAYHGDASLGESLVAPLGRVMEDLVR